MDASKHDAHTVGYVMCTRVRMKKNGKKMIGKVLRGSEQMVVTSRLLMENSALWKT